MADLERESGSGEKTKVVLVTRVHKEATDEKMAKLMDEIRFLESIPNEWKAYFPEIVVSGTSRESVFYEMPHYQLPTIRRLLFSGILDHKDILEWIDRILKFCFQMYLKETWSLSPHRYIQNMHFDRVRRRLDEVARKSPIFDKLISWKSLTINGRQLDNIPVALTKLDNRSIIDKVGPKFVSRWGHWDLHFSNILIDTGTDHFILIDPRGYHHCDYFYDYGKLWHSVNGKYEFIAERKFTLVGRDFELEQNNAYAECEKIKDRLPYILCHHSDEPPDTVMMKTEFNEAMHFAAVAPFLLDFDGKEERALVAYYTGVILLNEFMEKYL